MVEAQSPPNQLVRRLRWLLAVGLAIVVLLRLTIRDAWPWLSILYYCTPLPVIVFLSFIGTVLCRWQAGWRDWAAWILCFATFAMWWGKTDWRYPSPPALQNASGEFSILFWNVARHEDLTAAAEFINSVDADIVAMVEAGDQIEQRRQFWKETCPQYEPSMLGGGIQLLAKGASGEARTEELGPGSQLRELPVQAAGISCRVIIVDITSHPHKVRRGPLQRLAEIAGEYGHDPVIVVGDFNTPPDSVHFNPLRTEFRQAFEVAGKGYMPTWPVPVPVLQLDQTWVNEALEVVDCRQFWTSASDHRPVLVTLRPAAH